MAPLAPPPGYAYARATFFNFVNMLNFLFILLQKAEFFSEVRYYPS